MKILEFVDDPKFIERDCCQEKDLVDYKGSNLGPNISHFKFCRYCGTIHQWIPNPLFREDEDEGWYIIPEFAIKIIHRIGAPA